MVVNTNYIHNIGGYGEAFKIEVNGANFNVKILIISLV